MSEDRIKAEQWDAHWQENETPWDLGGVTPALIEFLRDRDVKRQTALIPGCGRGHDAHFFAKAGADVTAVDFAESALTAARAAYPDSKVDWQQADVTALPFTDQFDWVWEYTCFCALKPSQRESYLANVAKALKPGGRFFGLTFLQVHKPEGPPFAIDPEVLRAMLEKHFSIEAFEVPTERSVKPRRASEIWFVCCLKAD
jgi:SAM-dependent methyltransferase